MKLFKYMSKIFERTTLANAMMVLFVLGTTIGSALIFLPAGFIVGGVACGLYGYLLGSE